MGKDLAKSFKQYGPIHFLILGGHGTPDSIQFDKNEYLTKQDIEKGKGIQRADKFFVSKAPIALFSCLVGRKGGLAQSGSKIGNGFRVAASKSSSSPKSITPRFNGEFLEINVKYHYGPSSLYNAGKPIPRS